jgi:general stress protein YciG
MDPKTQKAISSMGGKATHEQRTAHEFTPEEARDAGSKGGKAVAKNRAHMARIGSLGGKARGRDRKAKKDVRLRVK